MKTKIITQKINIYELIGIILGDGSIWNYPDKRIYGLEISGNANEELEYFNKIANLIEKLTGKRPKIRIKKEKNGKTLKLVIYNKEFVEYLIKDLKIPYKNKTFTAKIDEKFLPWKYSKHIIRGLFETDGSLFFSKVSGKICYPRLEIKTSSQILAKQIIDIIRKNNFRVNSCLSKTDKTIRIYLSGIEMLEKWVKEIGFGSKKNLSKFLFWQQLGYYLPRSSTKERQLICASGQAAKISMET